jgi:hypothetical protein
LVIFIEWNFFFPSKEDDIPNRNYDAGICSKSVYQIPRVMQKENSDLLALYMQIPVLDYLLSVRFETFIVVFIMLILIKMKNCFTKITST